MIGSKFTSSTDFKKLSTVQLGEIVSFLRYGKDFPVEEDQTPLVTFRCLSRLLRVPLKRCHHALQRFELEQRSKMEVCQPKRAGYRKWMGQADVSEETLSKLVSRDALEEAAEQSLETRVSIFNREHPGSKLTRYYLRMLYKQNGVKKKVVKRQMLSTKSQDKQLEERRSFFEGYQNAIDRGDELVMIDECVFSIKGYQKNVWTRPGENVVISKRFTNTSCVAVVAAIGSKSGLIAFHHKRNSIKAVDFIDFLEWLYKKMGSKDYTMLLDQASIHKANITKNVLANKRVLYNIPYSPWYNGIELYWAQCKQHFRKSLLRDMLDKSAINIDRLVDQALQSVPDKNVKACARHALERIDKDKETTV